MAAYLYGPVHGFMIWNLFLAAIPAALAIVLFRRNASMGVAWWVLFGGWILFLPNAPYVLTDVMHMVDDLKFADSRLAAYATLLTFAVFFALGLVSYVVSLQLFRRHMHRRVPHRFVAPTMLALHGLVILAVYVGRFLRFNSWDAVLEPHELADAVMRVPRPSTIVILAVMFVVVGIASFATAAVAEKTYAQLRRFR